MKKKILARSLFEWDFLQKTMFTILPYSELIIEHIDFNKKYIPSDYKSFMSFYFEKKRCGNLKAEDLIIKKKANNVVR